MDLFWPCSESLSRSSSFSPDSVCVTPAKLWLNVCFVFKNCEISVFISYYAGEDSLSSFPVNSLRLPEVPKELRAMLAIFFLTPEVPLSPLGLFVFFRLRNCWATSRYLACIWLGFLFLYSSFDKVDTERFSSFFLLLTRFFLEPNTPYDYCLFSG